jgi:D-ribose pyranose/furanose isomerase RbsD
MKKNGRILHKNLSAPIGMADHGDLKVVSDAVLEVYREDIAIERIIVLEIHKNRMGR